MRPTEVIDAMCEDCGCGQVDRFGVQAMQAEPARPVQLMTEADQPVETTAGTWHTHEDGTTHRHAIESGTGAHSHEHTHGHEHHHHHHHPPDHSHEHRPSPRRDEPHRGEPIAPDQPSRGLVREGVARREPGDEPAGRKTLEIGTPVLARNQRLAERNRGYLRAKGVVALNLVSSPGAGKTTLLEKTLGSLRESVKAAVIVGDLATARDAERIRVSGAPVVQITTGTVCHLDAEMVARGLEKLDLEGCRLLFVENVGNLVCPSDFDLGEDLRVVLISVTEGEDKPLKYPPIFKSAKAVVITKVDLAKAAGADVDELRRNLAGVAPAAKILEVSARTGDGMNEWCEWLRGQMAAL